MLFLIRFTLSTEARFAAYKSSVQRAQISEFYVVRVSRTAQPHIVTQLLISFVVDMTEPVHAYECEAGLQSVSVCGERVSRIAQPHILTQLLISCVVDMSLYTRMNVRLASDQ